MAAAFGRQTPPAAPAPSSETSSRFQAGTLVTILGIFMIAAGVALLAVMIVWMIRSRQAHQ
jgi:heme/copper-type cytochrome/quinol oxidase subunit 2